MLITSVSKNKAKAIVKKLQTNSRIIDEDIVALDQTVLNYIIEDGDNIEQSVVYWLCRTRKGISILRRYPALVDKISELALSHTITEGEHKGYSAACWLSIGNDGEDLLLQYPGLVKKITHLALNSIVNEGEHRGQSVALWLCRSRAGRETLLKNPELASKISETTLNHIIKEGNRKGQSSAIWLCGTSTGREILLTHPGLVQNISQETLNHVIEKARYRYKGFSALFWLSMSKEGNKLLLRHPEVARKITTKALNHIIGEGAHKGQSAAIWLCAHTEGREMLLKNPHLVSMISETTLNHIIEKGEFEGQSVATWLCCSSEGRELLQKNPGLSKKISETILKEYITKNMREGCFTVQNHLQFASGPRDALEKIGEVVTNLKSTISPCVESRVVLLKKTHMKACKEEFLKCYITTFIKRIFQESDVIDHLLQTTACDRDDILYSKVSKDAGAHKKLCEEQFLNQLRIKAGRMCQSVIDTNENKCRQLRSSIQTKKFDSLASVSSEDDDTATWNYFRGQEVITQEFDRILHLVNLKKDLIYAVCEKLYGLSKDLSHVGVRANFLAISHNKKKIKEKRIKLLNAGEILCAESGNFCAESRHFSEALSCAIEAARISTSRAQGRLKTSSFLRRLNTIKTKYDDFIESYSDHGRPEIVRACLEAR